MAETARSDLRSLAGVFLVADGVGGLLLAGVVYLAVFAARSPSLTPVDETPAMLAAVGLLAFGVIALVAAALVLRGTRIGRLLGVAVGVVAAAFMLTVVVFGFPLSPYEILLALVIVAMQAVIAVPLAMWRG